MIDQCPYCGNEKADCREFAKLIPADLGRSVHWTHGEAERYGGKPVDRGWDDPFAWIDFLEANNLVEVFLAVSQERLYCYPEGDPASVLLTLRKGELVWVADTFWYWPAEKENDEQATEGK